MKTFVASMLAAFATAASDVAWDSLGSFKIDTPSFLNMGSFNGGETFLLASSIGGHNGNDYGNVYIVQGIEDAVKSGDVSKLKEHRLLNHIWNFQWPNDVKPVPDDVFDFDAIVVPDGFKGKHSNGSIYIMKMATHDLNEVITTVKIAHEADDQWFYHTGVWVDMNGDGRKDFLTARTIGEEGSGELVWCEHPESPLFDRWETHVIPSAPDVMFTVEDDAPYKHEIVVFAAEFWNKKLSMYRVSTKDGTLVDSRTIDDQIGHAYSVRYSDLNGDGHKELLVSNHESDENINGVWAYETPKDWMKDEWAKRTIATNFKPVKGGVFDHSNPMALGFAYSLQPQISKDHHIGEPRYILVAGDGDQKAEILSPTDAKNFVYDRDTIWDAKGQVGAMSR